MTTDSRTTAIPTFAPVEPDRLRAVFSVMVPTYEPGDMLRPALESVLSQALPRDDMQIAVVDDGSRTTDVHRLVRAIDPSGRVEIYADGTNLGISANWNRAIRLAHGHLVHLLHQDDLVLPGFYTMMCRAFLKAPFVGMAFCRSRIVDAVGDVIKTSSRQRWRPGILHDWLDRIAIRQRIQTPSAVVKRSTYEALGGYRADLRQTPDWEMWVRIAARLPVWYEPAALAVYRRHSSSESSRLLTEGDVWPDLCKAILINAESFPRSQQTSIISQSARWYAGSAVRAARDFLRRGEPDAARSTLAHGKSLLAMITEPEERRGIERRTFALGRRLDASDRAA